MTVKVSKYGVFVKGHDTELQIKEVETREDKRKVCLIKVRKPKFNNSTQSFEYDDVSEAFWVDGGVDGLIEALLKYKEELT